MPQLTYYLDGIPPLIMLKKSVTIGSKSHLGGHTYGSNIVKLQHLMYLYCRAWGRHSSPCQCCKPAHFLGL